MNIDHYWSKVDIRGPNECWLWTGKPMWHGYGRMGVENKRNRYAHDIGLEIKLGRPIRPGYKSLHTCHIRLCQNPNHLYEGTQQQNVIDMGQANRQWKVMTDEQRTLALTTQRGHAELGREFGVTHSAVLLFRRRNGWVKASSTVSRAAGS